MARGKVVSTQRAQAINGVILEIALQLGIQGLPPLVEYQQIAHALGLTKTSAHAIGQVLAAAQRDIPFWFLVFASDGTMITPNTLWIEQLAKFKCFCADLGIVV